jgi:hypothetical protein
MSAPKYLIDTNVFIGLEDWQEVSPEFAALTRLAAKYGTGVFVHEAARTTLRGTRSARRGIAQQGRKVALIARSGLTKPQLEAEFGNCPRPNDVVDATLLHALNLGVADFVVTRIADCNASHLAPRSMSRTLQLLRST